MADVVRMPKMSDTMTEGVIVAWHKKVGDKIKSGDLLAEIETDKAVMEFESFQEGVLLYIGPQKGESVKVDEVIAVLGKEGEDYKAALTAQEATTSAGDQTSKEKTETVKKETAVTPVAAEAVAKDTDRIKASPLAKKIASESGIAIESIKGSGDEGRIVKRDVENFISNTPSSASKPPQQVSSNVESYEDVPVSQMRKTIARRLAESKFGAPHFYLTMEINMDQCVIAREALNLQFPDKKVSYNDIIIKAAALALRKHPKVNASWLTDKIRYNHHVHIGMAVAVEDGLLVPVLKFADQKSLSVINEEAKQYAARAKEKKLQPDEMQGNTFTISNLGMMDIDAFTAIINPPDACILAVGKLKKIPAVVNGEIRIASVLTVTLSCDHRVVDGATGARFLQTFKSYLQNPLSMLY